MTEKQNQDSKLEEKIKELFLLAQQIADGGELSNLCKEYRGTLDGVTYKIYDIMGHDKVSLSTDFWGVTWSKYPSLTGFKYREDTRTGEAPPKNLKEILIALKSVPNEKRPKEY